MDIPENKQFLVQLFLEHTHTPLNPKRLLHYYRIWSDVKLRVTIEPGADLVQWHELHYPPEYSSGESEDGLCC